MRPQEQLARSIHASPCVPTPAFDEVAGIVGSWLGDTRIRPPKAHSEIIERNGAAEALPLWEVPDHDPETGEIFSLYDKSSPNPHVTNHPRSKARRQPTKAGERRHVREGYTTPRGVPWYEKDVFQGHRVSKRVVRDFERQEILDAVGYMCDRGTPPNLHIALKPPTDHLTPLERMKLWPKYRQYWRIFCLNHGFGCDCMFVAARESDPKTNDGEHEHLLVYCPDQFVNDAMRLIKGNAADFFNGRATKLIPGWCINAFVEPVVATEKRDGSKVKSIAAYILKAADQVSVNRDVSVTYRRSGAVLGDRVFTTRNVAAKARDKAYRDDPALQAARDERQQWEAILRRHAKEHRRIVGLKKIASQPIRPPVQAVLDASLTPGSSLVRADEADRVPLAATAKGAHRTEASPSVEMIPKPEDPWKDNPWLAPDEEWEWITHDEAVAWLLEEDAMEAGRAKPST